MAQFGVDAFISGLSKRTSFEFVETRDGEDVFKTEIQSSAVVQAILNHGTDGRQPSSVNNRQMNDPHAPSAATAPTAA